MRSEAAFASLRGVAAVPAFSGKVTRHCLSRGGDKQANWALYWIAVGKIIAARSARSPARSTRR